jgi:DNA-binding transcriptional regulator WhiA
MSPQQRRTASKIIRSIGGRRQKEKYLKSFTLYVDDREVYAKEIADALEADLQPLARSGLINRISKFDTNPANNPQPPKRTE